MTNDTTMQALRLTVESLTQTKICEFQTNL
jgi:hypothetical protein